ncbi:Adenosine deaminase 2-A [Psilocybe cubensis]|uniref:Adenosine deaminase 2-A n=2 Tax=Psilocybe cubensis TaxID=181762 RepID=A0ACB8H7C0_PSICU|nr:Adenosine deaminase 2-A [Psilocybe cubensis]KAH9483880.1 Adenosine deaminase 2-A [Psilocybe cubensis]
MAALSEYHAQRNSLIDADLSLRREYRNLHSRSSKELEADKIMRDIRALEAKTVWTADYPSIPHPFPGMEFLTGKSIIMKTKVFEILSKMPKGALLHAHLDATVDIDFLLQLALKQPGIHIRLHKPLSKSNLSTNLPEFRILPQEQYSQVKSISDPTYSLQTWVSLVNARNFFSQELGGMEGFDKWLIGTMTINPSEAYGTYNTLAKIWDKFGTVFQTSTNLFHIEPIFVEYVRQFFRSMIADGISYVEARINFTPKLMYGADGQLNVPHRTWLQIFERVMNEIREEMKQQSRGDDFIGARIIYSVVRSATPEELVWYLEDCITLKKEYPHLVAGFDLVGPENVLNPLIYYAEQLLRFQERQKEESLDIPFIFHAGETTGDGTEADSNLYDAILLGTKRIGHGYSLHRHPKLVEECRQKGIAVEVCPISNEILRLTSSMPMHPLPALLNYGVPVALCSDDPAVFGSMGLTYDFFQVFVASEITGLSTLGALARDSIEFSTLEKAEKERALGVFERRWSEFVEYIVVEYGAK